MRLAEEMELKEEDFYRLFYLGIIRSDSTLVEEVIFEYGKADAQNFWQDLLVNADDAAILIRDILQFGQSYLCDSFDVFIDSLERLHMKYRPRVSLILLDEILEIHEQICGDYFLAFVMSLLLCMLSGMTELGYEEEIDRAIGELVRKEDE